MKIICVGLNYRKHAAELGDAIPEEPVIFLKSDNALLINNKPFFYPEFSKEIHYETELVLKVSRLGRHIAPEFAHRYYNEVTVGIDFTARDLQRKHRAASLPWTLSKSFDNAAPIGKFVDKTVFKNLDSLQFSLRINDKLVQQGNSNDMIFSIDTLVSYISNFFTLKIGDLIFTGTPVGVGEVYINDYMQASIEDMELLSFYVR